MASVAGLSTRQLQRTLKETTGFSPHNLLKVLRLQNSFRSDYQLAFADQAHFTHSFRNATGYTPARFFKKFDV
jgi:AraC-like DNA-binding protein